MEEQCITTRTVIRGTQKTGRGGQIISWMLLAGVVAACLGSLPLALLFAVERITDRDSGFSLSEAPFLVGTMAMATAMAGAVHLTILGVLVFLPVRYAWRRPLSAGWATLLTSLAGGGIAALPFIISSLLKLTSDTVTITANTDREGTWILPAVYIGAGCVFGGLFGFTYAVLERRNGGLPDALKVASDEPVTKLSRWGSSVSAWTLAVLLVFTAGLFIYMFTTPARMISSARRAAVANQAAILAEAQRMLDEDALSEDGAESYGYSSERPVPPAFAKLGDVTASTSNRLPGVVKVPVTGGFTHYGLFIVPEPTSNTVHMLRDAVVTEDYGSLTIVNDYIYQYSEGP